jgi:uracil-DNA glycosylase
VEIRDAALQLRPFVGDVTSDEVSRYLGENKVSARQRDAAVRALRLACAVRNKAAGRPAQAGDAGEVAASRSATLDEEIRALLALARWWPNACAAAQHLTPSPTESARR